MSEVSKFSRIMLEKMKRHFGVDRIFWLDLETFSKCDLGDHGATVYAEHPSTEIMMGAYAFDNEPIKQWDKYALSVGDIDTPEEIPEEVIRALSEEDDRVLVVAWNMSFEFVIFKYHKGLIIPTKKLMDPMINAFYLSFPGQLAKVGPLVELPMDQQKDKDGKSLIRTFTMPAKPLKRQPDRTRIWPADEPEKYERFKAYNIQDVAAMRDVCYRLMQYAMPMHEWESWRRDFDLNDRGVPVNKKMAANACRIYDRFREKETLRLREITGLENPNSVKQLLAWLQDSGEYVFDNLRKASVARALLEEHLRPKSPLVIEALEIRRELAKTSATKYRKFRDTTSSDGTIKFALQFGGAQRTLRWSGRLVQPHNLKKPSDALAEVMPDLAHLIEVGDENIIDLIYGDPMTVLSEGIRGCIQAPPGYIFADSDLSAIENVVLGWAAKEEKILDVFRQGKDPYISFAQFMYDQPYEELWHEFKTLKEKKKRTVSKPAVLGCPRGDTLVLTESGWKRLDTITPEDRVHDGVEWVDHEGLVEQGVRSCQTMSGVVITPDHEIWNGETWEEIQTYDYHDWRRAIEAAAGLLNRSLRHDHLLAKCIGAVANAGREKRSGDPVLSNPTDRNTTALNVVTASLAATREPGLLNNTTFSLADFTQSDPGVQIQRTNTTNDTVGAGSSVTSTAPNTSFDGSSTTSDTSAAKSTASTMTATMSLETCATLIGAVRTEIEEIVTASGTPGVSCTEQSSGESSPPDTPRPAQFSEKYAKDTLPNRSFETNRNVGDHTVYDLLNCGPRNRFVVLTEDGPVVIHNCGYRLGPGKRYIDEQSGEEEATGLLGYAKAMYIDLTDKEAEDSVRIWRETYSEVKQFWYDLETAAFDTLRTGCVNEINGFTFDIKFPFMRIRLPSGRHLHYYKAHLRKVKAPWGDMVENVCYWGLKEGKWCMQSTHGGKFTENIVQAAARDILDHGMLLAHKEGIDVRLHVHDQDLALVREDNAARDLKILQECMAVRPSWAPDIPLNTGATLVTHFSKD